MTEFQKVMKDKKLMCDHFHSEQNGCSYDCPMIKANFNCTKQILEQAHDEEIIIEDWAKKNSVITNEMTFTVIDNKTGKEPNIDEVIKEPWAKGLMECDINCFALTEDGHVILIDDCDNLAYSPDGRFTVITEDGRVL